MSRTVKWTAGVAAGLLLAGGAYAGLAGGGGEDSDAAGLTTIPVERRDLQETVTASGRMEPIVRVPVISEVSGIISAVNVETGDRVVSGQPLFELDRERHEARVAELRAELAFREAQARYDLIGRAIVERDQAQRDLERTRALVEKSVRSTRDLERADHDYRLAKIAVRDARAETDARRASVGQSRERLRQAERDLDNATVRAPIDGVVIEREGEIGRAIADVTRSGGTTIAVIADDRRIRLVAEVDENDIASVAIGQVARLSIDALPGETFAGRVTKISSAGIAESNVSSFEVEVRLEPDERLRVGMSSDARIVVREHRAVLLIPNSAIVREVDGARVRRVDVTGGAPAEDSPADLVPVDLGYSDGFHTVIAGGLAEGDVVLAPREETNGGRG